MSLSQLHSQYMRCRTQATGVFGYLAMLSQGDFEGGEDAVVSELIPSVVKLRANLDGLRDMAAILPPGADAPSIRARIIAHVPPANVALRPLEMRLVKTGAGWSWDEALAAAQRAIREVATIQKEFEAAGLVQDEVPSAAVPAKPE